MYCYTAMSHRSVVYCHTTLPCSTGVWCIATLPYHTGVWCIATLPCYTGVWCIATLPCLTGVWCIATLPCLTGVWCIATPHQRVIRVDGRNSSLVSGFATSSLITSKEVCHRFPVFRRLRQRDRIQGRSSVFVVDSESAGGRSSPRRRRQKVVHKGWRAGAPHLRSTAVSAHWLPPLLP